MLDLVFNRKDFCSIKCSYPKEYNDPFELFLGVDRNISVECLAMYREYIGQLPQMPTTCFSKSPIIPPMWAHYAENFSGFVLEFDFENKKKCFKDIQIGSVNYKNAPNPKLMEFIQYANATKKPRHGMHLKNMV